MILKTLPAWDNSRNPKNFQYLLIITFADVSLAYIFYKHEKMESKGMGAARVQFFQQNRSEKQEMPWSELPAVTPPHLSQMKCKE